MTPKRACLHEQLKEFLGECNHCGIRGLVFGGKWNSVCWIQLKHRDSKGRLRATIRWNCVRPQSLYERRESDT